MLRMIANIAPDLGQNGLTGWPLKLTKEGE